jgi:YHS domain-containing protein
MKRQTIVCSILAACSGVFAVPAFAQHEGHDAGSAAAAGGVSAQLVSQCVESQRQSLGLVDAANARLESARQSNSPTEIRAALSDLQRGLIDMRTVLSRCTELQQALASAPAATTAGHDMSNMPAAPPAASPAAPKSGSTAGQGAASPHMVMVQTAFDAAKLTCSPKIDPKTAAKATYEGKTYYFCSTKDRNEFLTDPKMSLSMMPPKQ